MKIEDIELAKFRGQGGAVEMYKEGIHRLKQSGIFYLLRVFARPFTVDRGANPYSAAYTAAHTEGYNKCLDDLIYFEEQYLTEQATRKNVQATFGGLGMAVAQGKMTKEEAEQYGSRKKSV